MTSRGQCPRGGACECPRVGAFSKLMTSRGQCPRGGGAPGVPPIQVQTPPHLAGWLRACVLIWRLTSRYVLGAVIFIINYQERTKRRPRSLDL